MSFTLRPMVRGITAAFGGAALLSLVATPALAQQAGSQATPQKLERIEVTGSNIKRTDIETPAPVTVITKDELLRSGATTLGDVITKLTMVQGGLSGVEFSGFTPGAATIALRGLGGGATLVLINGRRIAPYGITGFQEVLTSVNSLPVSAIDRIDILKDGASAIYGSEAIAGVINIIMRRDFTGFEAQAQHTMNAGSVLNNTRVGISGGIGDLAADHYNIFGVYEHVDQKHSVVSQNKFYPTRNLAPMTGQADQDFRSAYSVPGNLLGPTRTIPGTTCDPKNVRTVGGVDRCVLDTFDYNTMTPRIQRDSLVSQATFDFSANLTGFAEFNISRGKYGYQFDPQFYYNNAAQTVVVSGAPYGLSGNVQAAFRAGDIGPRHYDVTEDTYRLLTGLKGTIGKWDFDTAIGVMSDKVRLDQTGAILSEPMDAALANGSYIPGFINSPSVLATISPKLVRKGKANTYFADARASTEFGALPGGPVGFSMGVDLRRETQKDSYDPRLVNGEVFGFGSLDDLDASRTVTSAFAEFRLPLLTTLEAQIAARYDHYSVGGNSTTPKVGLKWTVTPTFVARGTWGRGFRAANARETSPNPSIGFYNGVTDPVRCPTVTSTNPDCSLSVQATISGNPDLQPEKSKSFTAGFVFEPVKDTSFTLDYWKIDRTNEITNLDINFLLAHQDVYAGYITRDGSGSISAVALPYVNLSGTTVKGIDLEFKSKVNFGEYGKVFASAQATRFLNYYIQPAPDAEREDYNGTYAQPRMRLNMSVGWERDPWQAELRFNHVDGYSNAPTPSSTCSAPATLSQYCDVGAWNTFGLFGRYKGFKNFELSLNIDNLFDRAPPFDYRAARNSQSRAWGPTYHNAFGRTYQFNVLYRFK